MEAEQSDSKEELKSLLNARDHWIKQVIYTNLMPISETKEGDGESLVNKKTLLCKSVCKCLKGLIDLGPFPLQQGKKWDSLYILKALKDMHEHSGEILADFLDMNPNALEYFASQSSLAKHELKNKHISLFFLNAVVTCLTRDLGAWIKRRHVAPGAVLLLTLLHQVSREQDARNLSLKLADVLASPQSIDMFGLGEGVVLDPGYMFRSTSHANPHVYFPDTLRYSIALASPENMSLLPTLLSQLTLMNSYIIVNTKIQMIRLVTPWLALFGRLISSVEQRSPHASAGLNLARQVLYALLVITKHSQKDPTIQDYIRAAWINLLSDVDTAHIAAPIIVDALVGFWLNGIKLYDIPNMRTQVLPGAVTDSKFFNFTGAGKYTTLKTPAAKLASGNRSGSSSDSSSSDSDDESKENKNPVPQDASPAESSSALAQPAVASNQSSATENSLDGQPTEAGADASQAKEVNADEPLPTKEPHLPPKPAAPVAPAVSAAVAEAPSKDSDSSQSNVSG
jgi:hypothetical protein